MSETPGTDDVERGWLVHVGRGSVFTTDDERQARAVADAHRSRGIEVEGVYVRVDALPGGDRLRAAVRELLAAHAEYRDADGLLAALGREFPELRR